MMGRGEAGNEDNAVVGNIKDGNRKTAAASPTSYSNNQQTKYNRKGVTSDGQMSGRNIFRPDSPFQGNA
jgi:hypothetical protein